MATIARITGRYYINLDHLIAAEFERDDDEQLIAHYYIVDGDGAHILRGEDAETLRLALHHLSESVTP